MHHLVPNPAFVALSGDDVFTVGPSTVIRVGEHADDHVLSVARYLSALIGRAAGPEPPRIESSSFESSDPAIVLDIGTVTEAGDEAYDLDVSAAGVTIRGRTPAGVFDGVQTLRQLMPAFVEYRAARVEKGRALRVPCGRVADTARFEWRGAMLDVARHFMPVDEVKRFIDVMALHKLNRLHLHLTDDQGWRIEIKSWPRLATHGGSTQVGGGAGGWYSQSDYVEMVRHAAERFITVVPEIDVPGHTNAALASYPELGAAAAPALYTGIEVGFSVLSVDRDLTYKFVDDVVREVSALTPGPFFHIGGDEVRTLAADQYASFIERVQDIVRAHGKRTIGWDEISPAPLLPDTIVQHWRPKTTPRDAVSRGARVILSPAERVYLDMKYDAQSPIGLTWAGLIDVSRAYEWDPASAVDGVDESAILGVEAPLWTETVANMRDVEYQMFPRLAAIAEVAWSRPTRRAVDEFTVRLGAQAERWTALGINFHRAPGIPWIVGSAPPR